MTDSDRNVTNWATTKPNPYTGHIPSCSKCGNPGPILIDDIPYCEACGRNELMLANG